MTTQSQLVSLDFHYASPHSLDLLGGCGFQLGEELQVLIWHSTLYTMHFVAAIVYSS